jgi:hypothetical protein
VTAIGSSWLANQVVRCSDLYAWGRWLEHADRQVKLTIQGDVYVSTVFLGLDHRMMSEGPPILFETMAFGIPGFEYDQERYSTWDEAVEGHDRWVNRIFKPTPILRLPLEA